MFADLKGGSETVSVLICLFWIC